MILVDTSVWIEFFRRNADVIEEVQSMITHRLIASFEPVFAELLYGVRSKRDKQLVISYWQVLPRIDFRSDLMLEAAVFANKHDYHQLGIGLMDALIIKSTLDGDHLLWTLDKRINSNIDGKYIFQSS